MVLISAVPADRAALAIEAMEAGKDVMVDKPGCTTLEQLTELPRRAGPHRADLVGQFLRTVRGAGRHPRRRAGVRRRDRARGADRGSWPHKQNLKTRPEWFFERERYGGILCDIGSHQIDQFLHFTGSTHAPRSPTRWSRTPPCPSIPAFRISARWCCALTAGTAMSGSTGSPPTGCRPGATGGCSSKGTEGHIELRKYTDIGRPHQTNNLFLVNGTRNELIDCNDAGLPYFPRLAADVQDRTETAVAQAHTFTTMELAIRAQA